MATTYPELDEKEPLSEEGTMSFLDHLDELRKRLIRSALFIAAAFVICFFVSDQIYNFLQVPVRAAMLDAKRTFATELSGTAIALSDLPDETDVVFTLPIDAKLGTVLIYAGTAIPCKVRRDAAGKVQLVTGNYWMIDERTVVEKDTLIPANLYQSANTVLGRDNQLVVPTVQGAFNLYIKVSFYAAIFFAVPFLLVQIWGFVAPGLYPHEKKYAAPIIIMASVFFLAGCAFAYYIAFPRAANFLLGVATGGNLRPLVTADEYFDLIIIIMLGLGVVFEIPTVTFFLSRLGLVSPGLLLRVWRYAMIVIFIVAALLSPTTDIPNLLVFAAPMMILYFLSVGIAWVFHRKRQTETEYQDSERKGS
ncbi:MAG TPA: twin-arginine translocase subunit TatC [Blastocatellia bacterium]|nr:twin-arginine translocase subunit TatC [Blastocatellia bacterium]